jgi:hypothetical protein
VDCFHCLNCAECMNLAGRGHVRGAPGYIV